MDKAELEELWRLLGKADDSRLVELARLAVCEIRSHRAALESLRDAIAACDK